MFGRGPEARQLPCKLEDLSVIPRIRARWKEGKAPATKKLPSDLSLYLLFSLSSTPLHTYCTHTIIHKTFNVFVGWHVLQTALLMSSSEAVLQRAVCPVTPLPCHCGWSFVKVWTFTAAPWLKKPPQPQQHTG